MTIKTHIECPRSGNIARVVDGTEPNALVVATRQLKTYYNDVNFFLNDTYGIDMNQNAGFGGTPIGIHDGLDSTLWTGSMITGSKVTFNSGIQAHSGSQSVRFNAPALGDVAQFDNGSGVNLGGYTAITLWIYVEKDWTTGDSVEIYGWDTGTGTQVGTSEPLEEHFSSNVFGTWQKITISLIDLGVSIETIDSIRFQMQSVDGKAPVFFIDDIQIEETGAPIVYTLTPRENAWTYIDTITYVLVDAYDGRLADSTMPNLSYDKFLGLSALSGGITWAEHLSGEVESSFTSFTLMDALELPNAKLKDSGTDGTNTWITIEFKFSYPILLKAENRDFLTVTINDDMTGLLRFRSYSSGWYEERTLNGSSVI